MRVLFVLKKRNLYSAETKKEITAGLHNSATFVSEMLTKLGVLNKVVYVVDNNCIDREVHQYKPTHVIIEALWVVPEKFEILQKLHPNVKWIVRTHSNIPFLANEGISIDWIVKYVKHSNVSVAPNSERALEDIRYIISRAYPTWSAKKLMEKVVFLPNYFSLDQKVSVKFKFPRDKNNVDIACFGAIRPLKNNLNQAIAAIKFADLSKKRVWFHINATRAEQGGESNLKNLRSLFFHAHNAELVEHEWMERPQFLEIIANCDLSLCTSFTETFCIVAADSVLMNVPLVGSPEIPWISSFSKANPVDVDNIVDKMFLVTGFGTRWATQKMNESNLKSYAKLSETAWLNYLKKGISYQ